MTEQQKTQRVENETVGVFVPEASQVLSLSKMNGKPCSLLHCFLAVVHI